MKNEVTGRITRVLPLERGTSQRGEWLSAKVVIEYESGRYNSTLCLECRNNRAEEFSKLRAGQKGTFYYDVTSREYNGKWYHNVNCFDWKIEGAAAPAPAPAPAPGNNGAASTDGDPF